MNLTTHLLILAALQAAPQEEDLPALRRRAVDAYRDALAVTVSDTLMAMEAFLVKTCGDDFGKGRAGDGGADARVRAAVLEFRPVLDRHADAKLLDHKSAVEHWDADVLKGSIEKLPKGRGISPAPRFSPYHWFKDTAELLARHVTGAKVYQFDLHFVSGLFLVDAERGLVRPLAVGGFKGDLNVLRPYLPAAESDGKALEIFKLAVRLLLRPYSSFPEPSVKLTDGRRIVIAEETRVARRPGESPRTCTDSIRMEFDAEGKALGLR